MQERAARYRDALQLAIGRHEGSGHGAGGSDPFEAAVTKRPTPRREAALPPAGLRSVG